MTCPSYSGAATCRTALSARLLPGSSPTPRVHESDETTVRPMRGEAPEAPARVSECTTQQESCQLLHTHVTASPRRCWRHARRQGRPRPTSSPWRDCGQGVHLPPHLSQFERGLSWCMRVGGEVSVAEEGIGSVACNSAFRSTFMPLFESRRAHGARSHGPEPLKPLLGLDGS